jgi:isoaspartyl peptidase/L-asparaginase-like protein (Ntn-hydrolase superfamily)
VIEASVATRDEMKELVEVLLEATRLVVVALVAVRLVKKPVTAVRRVVKKVDEVLFVVMRSVISAEVMVALVRLALVP